MCDIVDTCGMNVGKCVVNVADKCMMNYVVKYVVNVCK